MGEKQPIPILEQMQMHTLQTLCTRYVASNYKHLQSLFQIPTELLEQIFLELCKRRNINSFSEVIPLVKPNLNVIDLSGIITINFILPKVFHMKL